MPDTDQLAGEELVVVAATEGWKPQTEEHLRILELLGVRHGLVALTKVGIVVVALAFLFNITMTVLAGRRTAITNTLVFLRISVSLSIAPTRLEV